jgi:hypothetical protein
MPNPIDQYFTKTGRYPGNNQQWWLARADVADPDATPAVELGDFLPELLNKLFPGNMLAPRGHFILEAFNKDRSESSGVSSLPIEALPERPPTCTFFSGRVWWGCKSTVYFSQVLTDKHKAGKCYMEADPTSEHISDPIATDGGSIEIPEANGIIRLAPHAGGVLVFASNGVWYITGTSQGFSALDISVNKISPIGTSSPLSVVETDNAVFWWSHQGIMGATQSMGQYGPIPGKFESLNISQTSVQGLYDSILDSAKDYAKGVFDARANTIYWIYFDETTEGVLAYNRVLCYDLTLQAFVPWEFAFNGTLAPVVKGFYISDRSNTYTITTDIRPSNVEYIIHTPETTTNFRIGQVRSGNFVDWYTMDNVGISYDSYVEAGYELFDDAMRRKNITYIFTYLTRTEDASGNNPSSCKMRIKFDWASGSNSNKWTPEVQVYRPSPAWDTGDTGFGMVVTKHKVRGNGKAIQFRFGTNEAGKNFDLNGWSVAVSGNVSP